MVLKTNSIGVLGFTPSYFFIYKQTPYNFTENMLWTLATAFNHAFAPFRWPAQSLYKMFKLIQ